MASLPQFKGLNSLTPGAAGIHVERPADFSDEATRQRLSPSAIRAFVKVADKWGLNEMQSRALLGGLASSTYHVWKSEPDGRKLDQDTLTRISLVLGIFKALQNYFGEPWADRWVTLVNRDPMFLGRAPIDYMIQNGIPGMLEIRDLLDAWCEGS
jgi:hypothetical protein